jgi:NADH:ubiquinone oxidoreductase subunit 3 (subunit A)
MFNPTLLTLFLFLPVLIGILLLLNLLLAPHQPDPEKITTFECGFSPVFGQTRNPFHIQFYLVAILFLIFDLEIFYMVPLTVALNKISLYGFTIFAIFFVVLTIGFVYELGAKVLEFSKTETSSKS